MKIDELMVYFATSYPGKKDPADIQRLKGMTREFEAECIWGYFGWNCSNVLHLRLGFYSGDIFTEEPTIERDVKPIRDMLESIEPDVVSVAFDPRAAARTRTTRCCRPRTPPSSSTSSGAATMT
jgi:glucosamine-6-phosphate deaminase